MNKRKNLVMILLICIACFLSTTAIVSFAVAYKQNQEKHTTTIGRTKIVSIDNSTLSKLEYKTSGSSEAHIKINLDCNVDAVIRVKVSPRFYDENDRIIVVPNNLEYVFDSTKGTWTADQNNMCFYFNGSVKDLTEIDFIREIKFSNHNYENYKFDLIVEADILQMAVIDYSNHPWKDNAPQEWINLSKNI